MMESERIILRKWEMKDTYVLVKNLNDSKMAYDLGTEYPYTFEMACKYIRDAIKYNKEKYAIVYKKNMKVIGGCGLHIMDKMVSGNMWLSKKYQGIGIGTETAIVLVDYCFKKLDMDRMYNIYFENNKASKNMQEKIGGKVCEGSTSIVVTGKVRVKKNVVITKNNFEKAVSLLRG